MTTQVVTKATGQLLAADEGDDAPHGAFSLVLSTPTEDRDGESLATDEWEQPLPGHITFDLDHAMSVAGTVGSGTPSIDDQGRLVVDGTYASTPLGQEVRSLVNEGHIRTASVAFLRKTDKKDSKVTRELLNGAFVAIPANPEALILASKSGARNSASDMEHLQAIHDHAAAAGATCPADSSKSATKVVVKSIVDSVEALQDRVRDALEDAYDDDTYLRGVLPSGDLTSGGTVVFDQEDGDTYQQSYTDDGSVVTLTGDPTEIDVHEVVVPDADADRETNEKNAHVDKSADVSDPDPDLHRSGSGSEAADLDTELAIRAAQARAALTLTDFGV